MKTAIKDIGLNPKDFKPLPRELKAHLLIGREFGDLEGDELAVAIMLKYHPKLSSKEPKKAGRKQSWGLSMCVTLAVLINKRPAGQTKADCYRSLAEPDCIWFKTIGSKNQKLILTRLASKNEGKWALNVDAEKTFRPHYNKGNAKQYRELYELVEKFYNPENWNTWVEKVIKNQ